MTGFSFYTQGDYSTSQQVTGGAYAADQAPPIPLKMTNAIADMELAYSDAASRSVANPSALNVQGGLITGVAFPPGVYHWDTDINLHGAIHLHPTNAGSASTDRFIFQTTGNIIVGLGSEVVLAVGLQAANIVWQSAGYVQVGASAKMKGIFLTKTHATFLTHSSLDGRILAQTAVTLDQTTVTHPAFPEFPGEWDGEETEQEVGGVVLAEVLLFGDETVDVFLDEPTAEVVDP
jgi:hypothetical protein